MDPPGHGLAARSARSEGEDLIYLPVLGGIPCDVHQHFCAGVQTLGLRWSLLHGRLFKRELAELSEKLLKVFTWSPLRGTMRSPLARSVRSFKRLPIEQRSGTVDACSQRCGGGCVSGDHTSGMVRLASVQESCLRPPGHESIVV